MTLEEHIRQEGPNECLKIHDRMKEQLSEGKQGGKIPDKRQLYHKAITYFLKQLNVSQKIIKE